MKKIYVMLLAMATMASASCSEETDGNGEGNNNEGGNGNTPTEETRLVTKITKKGIDGKLITEMTMEYDGNRKIKKLVDKYWGEDGYTETETYHYKHTGSQIIVECTDTWTEGEETHTEPSKATYEVNAAGYVTERSTAYEGGGILETFSYNSRGELTANNYDETHGNGESTKNETTFTWADGNLVGNSLRDEYTYSKEENKSNFDFGAFFWTMGSWNYLGFFGHVGTISKNFLIDNNGYTTYRYTFDKDGYATEIKRLDGETLESTYTIEYK